MNPTAYLSAEFLKALVALTLSMPISLTLVPLEDTVGTNDYLLDGFSDHISLITIFFFSGRFLEKTVITFN